MLIYVCSRNLLQPFIYAPNILIGYNFLFYHKLNPQSSRSYLIKFGTQARYLYASHYRDATGPTFQYAVLVVEHQNLRHYRVRMQFSNSESGNPIRQRVITSRVYKSTMEELREIRPDRLPFSRLEGIWFRDRKRATFNEDNSEI